VPTTVEAEARLRAEGLAPHAWSNGGGFVYGWHKHPAAKVLYCVRGAIVIHVEGDDLAMVAGDRLELAGGVEHAATVGTDGVHCVEAYRG
jgi:hypothetical protein